jgi:hypothetical protein
MVTGVLAEITVASFCENGNKTVGPEACVSFHNLRSV